MNNKVTKKLVLKCFPDIDDHNAESVEAALTTDVEFNGRLGGQIIKPTGTGKTWIQAAIIAMDILQNPEMSGIYILQVPRIILSYQQLKALYEFNHKHNINVSFLIVHSGERVDTRDLLKLKNDNIMWTEIPVTTNEKDIKEYINNTHAISNYTDQSQPLIIIQTYHSSDRTFNALKDLKIVSRMKLNDECHHLVTSEFSHILHQPTEFEFGFTGTRKLAHVIGMNNEDIWGPVLDIMNPRKAIDKGLSVRPRMLYMKSRIPITKEDFDASLEYIIESDFITLKEEIGGKGKGIKLFFCTRGLKDIETYMNSKSCKDAIKRGRHIFGIGSNKKIGNWYNGIQYKRTEWLDTLKEIGEDDTKDILVLHFDILTEGLDIPGFDGIAFLTAKDLIKFLQNYGRTNRLHPEDRRRLRDGTLKVHDLENWKKAYSYVILHDFNDVSSSETAQIEQMIHNLREAGFDPDKEVIIKTQKGTKDGVDPETLLTKEVKEKTKRNLLDKYQIWHELESERKAKVTQQFYPKILAKALETFFGKG